MKTLIIKTLLFTAIISFVIYKIDPFFVQQKNEYKQFSSFYNKKKKSIDVLFLGNSHAQFGINTKVINAKCNVKSYNLSLQGINIFQIYFNLLESLKYQNPKLVVIENFPIISPDQSQDFLDESGKMIFKNHNSVHAKQIGLTKIEEIKLSYPNSKLINGFNIFKNHENWSDLKNQSKVFNFTFNEASRFQDFIRNSTKISQDKVKQYQKNKFLNAQSIIFSKDENECIKKIIDLSLKKNFKILFVTLPIYNVYYNKVKSYINNVNIKLKKIIQNSDNVKFLDMNETHNLDFNYFINDNVNHNQHLNDRGNIITSNYLSNYINSYFPFNMDIEDKIKDLNPEDLLYNKKNILNTKRSIAGEITTVNNRTFANKTGRGVIKLAKNEGRLKIDGWMYHEGINLKKAEKIIGLKKDDDFVFISASEQLNDREDPLLVKKYGKAYKYSGYSFSILRALLETGTYKIYHLLRTENGDLLISDTNKDVII